jgi:hypothetical protein
MVARRLGLANWASVSPRRGTDEPSPLEPGWPGWSKGSSLDDPDPWRALAVFGGILSADSIILPAVYVHGPVADVGVAIAAFLLGPLAVLFLSTFTPWLAGAVAAASVVTVVMGFYFAGGWTPTSSPGQQTWPLGPTLLAVSEALLLVGGTTLAFGIVQAYRARKYLEQTN